MTKLENAGIYVLRCRPTGKYYVGKDVNLGKRVKQHLVLKEPNCPAIHAAIKKHGADAFDVELIPYPGISSEALKAIEKWKIRQLDSYCNGYNRTEGGDGIGSETAREINLKRVEDGTHNFLDEDFQRETRERNREAQRRYVEEGTHHFLDEDFQRKRGERSRESQRKRVEKGTHPFLGGERSRESQRKRVAKGTHHLLDPEWHRRQRHSNPALDPEWQKVNQRKRVTNGTHHFLSGEIQRETNHRRVANGTHNFLGENNPNHRRIADGTHHFLGDNNWRRKKRKKAEWMWVRSLAMCWYEMNDYVVKRRAEFHNKGIPDTSKSEQLHLF